MQFNKFLPIQLMILMLGITGLGFLADGTTVTLRNGSSYFNGAYNGAEDCYLRQPYGDYSTGRWDKIAVGWETYMGGGKARSLIRFNFSDFNSALVSSSHVTAASLTLTIIGIDGDSIKNAPIYLYKVSEDNKNWTAGVSPLRTVAEVGAACWNWVAYSNVNFSPTDVVNCPNPSAGCPQRYPWKGDIAAYQTVWPTLTTFKGSGCGISGSDYNATPVASLTTSQPRGLSTITTLTFTFTDPSIFLPIIKGTAPNTGFLITSPSIETGSAYVYSTILFASSENAVVMSRPALTLVFDTLNAPVSGITYNLPRDGKVSLHISDSITGKVVKELLFASPRSQGDNTEYWDGTADPEPQRIGATPTVPNGTYKVKMLATQGLSAEYLQTVGASGSIWLRDQMPGNHVAPGGIAVDDTALYISATENENKVGLRKQNINSGSAYWTMGSLNGFEALHSISISEDALYGVSYSGKYVSIPGLSKRVAGDPYGGQMESFTRTTTVGEGTFVGHYGWNVSARRGRVLIGNHISNSFCWVTPATGAKIGSPISVTNLNGVAVDLQGNALILSGTTFVKYTYGSTTPTTVAAASSHLSNPNRMDINPVNGDIYVLEYSTMQVMVFNSSGVFKRALGRVGGRGKNGYGTYDPTQGFYHGATGRTPAIAVAADGSFFVGEQEPVRRVARYDSLGTFIKEWYCGTVYAPHATADADDPRIIWVNHDYNGVMRCQVDYVAQTWKILGVYQTNKPPVNPIYDWTRWNCLKRGGKTYLVSSQFPQIYYFDEVGDSLKMIAVGGNTNAITGYGSWADLNGDGQVQPNEIIAPPANHGYESNCCTNMHGVNFTDSNFVTYGNMMNISGNVDGWLGGFGPIIGGPAVYAPKSIQTVNGVATPVYDLANLSQPFKSNSVTMCATMDHWIPNGGGSIDANGGVYSAYIIHSEQFDTDPYNATTWYPNTLVGGMKLVKGNLNTQKISWVVGRYAPTAGSPPEGYICKINHMLGSFRGCVGIADYYPVQHVYDSTGLFVGRFYDQLLPKNGVNLPGNNVLTCGEQFGGSAIEVKRNDIPGLSRGDVLFFSAADNTVAIMRIHGFDGWVRVNTTIKIQAGKIVSQGVVDVGVLGENGKNWPAMTLANANFKVLSRSGAVTMSYSIPAQSPVSLVVYSMQGRKVATLVNGLTEGGTHSIVWNSQTKKIPVGYYLAQLKVGNQSIFKKLTIME